MSNYKVRWTQEAPSSSVNPKLRNSKYRRIREGVLQLSTGKSEKPFMTVTANTSSEAGSIASIIATFRNSRSLNNISYRKRGNTVTVWNNKVTTVE